MFTAWASFRNVFFLLPSKNYLRALQLQQVPITVCPVFSEKLETKQNTAIDCEFCAFCQDCEQDVGVAPHSIFSNVSDLASR